MNFKDTAGYNFVIEYRHIMDVIKGGKLPSATASYVIYISQQKGFGFSAPPWQISAF
jgi:hypothetical protein